MKRFTDFLNEQKEELVPVKVQGEFDVAFDGDVKKLKTLLTNAKLTIDPNKWKTGTQIFADANSVKNPRIVRVVSVRKKQGAYEHRAVLEISVDVPKDSAANIAEKLYSIGASAFLRFDTPNVKQIRTASFSSKDVDIEEEKFVTKKATISFLSRFGMIDDDSIPKNLTLKVVKDNLEFASQKSLIGPSWNIGKINLSNATIEGVDYCNVEERHHYSQDNPESARNRYVEIRARVVVRLDAYLPDSMNSKSLAAFINSNKPKFVSLFGVTAKAENAEVSLSEGEVK